MTRSATRLVAAALLSQLALPFSAYAAPSRRSPLHAHRGIQAVESDHADSADAYHNLTTRATPLSFSVVGNSIVSAQQMFLGTSNKVYVIDKTENNPTQVNGHPAWASEYDVNSNSGRPLNVKTNTFCAGGASLGDGRWINVGGNQGVKQNGVSGGSANSNPPYYGGDPYKDYDGGYAVRLITPCDDESCQWIDSSANYMSTRRWYPTLEPLDDGRVIIIGGDKWGGYVNSANQNNPTYEFYPGSGPGGGRTPITLKLLQNTLPANLYPLTWLMPSGKLFIQAGWGTALLDYKNRYEKSLPNVPAAVRTYPASGATALLPLTPANNYKATVLMCGGQDRSNWNPGPDLINQVASTSCVRISPDDANPTWETDTPLPEGRTMGNFILLPDGKIWLGNGAHTGTAGYGTETHATGDSYATQPLKTPTIYDPIKRSFSRSGIQSSGIARMYHSSALLLTDGSILVAGSNPHTDKITSGTPYPTEYRTEKYYPWYYNNARPAPAQDLPSTLSYGGSYFDVSLSGASLGGYNATTAGQKTKAVVIRTGFSTHGLNMGQRYLQLNGSFTPSSDGQSLTMHFGQIPPNPALFPPGPAVLYVVVAGVPSQGQTVMVGNGVIGTQGTQPVQALPGILSTAH